MADSPLSNSPLLRRSVLAAAVCVPLLTACGKQYPQYFDIEWDEEVMLHDGRMIVVHVKRFFERRKLTAEWKNIAYRDTEVSFDTGIRGVKFKQKFLGYQVHLIDNKNGRWYIMILHTDGSPPKVLVDERHAYMILEPDGELRAATSLSEVPEFPRNNLMPMTPSVEALSQFSNKLLLWQQKLDHWKKYPRGPGDNGIHLPRKPKSTEN